MSNQLVRIEDSVYGALQEAGKVTNFPNPSRLDAEKNYAIQLLYKNQMSSDVARANPVSVHNAIVNLSAIGISLNPATKHAYLVPRDGAICLDISYMGLMHLAQETGSILWGQSKIVYANDTYENTGMTSEPSHKYSAFGDRGEKVGVYCTVKLPNGDFLTEEMSAQQVHEVRNTSKAKNSSYSPWNTFEEEMWRKSVVKRASKYWPKSGDRFDKAVHVLNEHEGLEDDSEEKSELVKKLNLYNSDEHTPIELFAFTESVRAKSDELHQWLCSQFQKGKKTAGCKKIGEGRSQFFDYLEIFKGGDESAIEECKTELTELELQLINRQLGH